MFSKSFGVSLLILLLCSIVSFSQEIRPSGVFLEDSISIGRSIPYSLSVRYPKNSDIVFPDSLFDFSPYELEDKVYYPTKSDDTFSFDSTVYYLTSFEIDSVQYLSLPIFLLQNGDSLEIRPDKDSVFLKQVVSEIPDSVAVEALPLKENTIYKRVNLQFNYPYFLIGAGIFVVVVIVLLVVFGGRVMKYFKLRRMQKLYNKYVLKFDELLTSVSKVEDIENLLAHWKRYLEKLEQQPYTKLTTKEILSLNTSERIEQALKGIDRTIYANASSEMAANSFNTLKSFAQERYELKVEEVKNA